MFVVFLTGPIGAGKTSLGRALSNRLNAGFIDGDDLSAPEKSWRQQIKTTSEAIVRAALDILRDRPIVVIANPLRRRDWIYFKHKFAAAGVSAFCITLSASYEAIASRGREFSETERSRIHEMIGQGYASAESRRKR